MVLDEEEMWVGRGGGMCSYLGSAVDDAARGVRVEETGGGRGNKHAGDSISHISTFILLPFISFPPSLPLALPIYLVGARSTAWIMSSCRL